MSTLRANTLRWGHLPVSNTTSALGSTMLVSCSSRRCALTASLSDRQPAALGAPPSVDTATALGSTMLVTCSKRGKVSLPDSVLGMLNWEHLSVSNIMLALFAAQ